MAHRGGFTCPPRLFGTTNVLRAVVTSVVVLLLYWARRPSLFAKPQLWAEDGPIFFVQADTLGRRALATPYAGYQLLFCRVVGALGARVHAARTPAVYFVSCMVITTAVVLALFSRRIHVPQRVLMALALPLVPQTGEIVGALCNVQWILALGLVWLLLAADASRVRQYAADGVAALVVGLTGVFSVLFAPQFAWRAWRRRTWSSLALAAVALLAAALQARTVLRTGTPPPGPPRVMDIAWMTGFRVVGSLLLPSPLAQRVPLEWGALLGVAYIVVLAIVAFASGRHRATRVHLVGCIGALLAATGFRFGGVFMHLVDLEDGDRYFFLPKLLTVWLLLLGWSDPRGLVRWSTRIAGGMILVATLTHWSFPHLADDRWPAVARGIEAGNPNPMIVVNPGFTFSHPGRH